MFFSTAATSVAALLMICACRFDASSMCRHSSYDHARHRDFVGTLTARRSSRNQLFRVGVVRCRVKIYWRLKLPMQRGSKRQGQRQRRGGAVWYGGISWPALHTCSYTNFVPIVSQQKNVVITVSISQQVLTQLHGTVTVKATKLSTHSTGTFFCFSQKKCVFNQPSDQHRKEVQRAAVAKIGSYVLYIGRVIQLEQAASTSDTRLLLLRSIARAFLHLFSRLRREFAQRHIMMRDLLSRSRAGKSSACVPIPQARFKTIAFDDGCLTHYASALIAPCLCQPPKTWPRCAASAVPSSSHSLTR